MMYDSGLTGCSVALTFASLIGVELPGPVRCKTKFVLKMDHYSLQKNCKHFKGKISKQLFIQLYALTL